MSMNSKEIMKAALYFNKPERLPVRMGGLGRDDVQGIPRKSQPVEVDGQPADEWGCIWGHTDVRNMGQVKGHPLNDLSEYDKAVIPDYTKDEIYEGCEAAFQAAENAGKYTVAGIFMILFERMHSLAGFENVLTGLFCDRENAEALADRILDAQITLVRQYQERFGKRLDAFGMSEDWGTQEACFISTELWYDFFYPRYKKLYDIMHEGGQDVWVHSCGKVNEAVQGFIDAGANVINLQQPRALGIAEMGERYRGKITFESLADIQATLPTGDREKIAEDARQLAEHWMTPEGGFVFSDYGDGAAIGAPTEAKIMMYEEFSRISEEIYGNPLPEPIIS